MRNLFCMGIMAIMSIFLVSCNKALEEVSDGASNITLSFKRFLPENDTKTNFNTTDYTITWTSDDVIGIFPLEGYQEPFIIPADQVGKSSAVVDGGYWALKDGYKYNAYYPFDKANFDSAQMKTKIGVTYNGQSQDGNNCNIGAFDYTYSNWVEAVDGNAYFLFDHIGAIMSFTIKYPVTANYTEFSLVADSEIFPTSGTYDLTAENVAFKADEQSMQNSISVSLTNHHGTASENGTIYMMVPPLADLGESEIKATLKTESGEVYTLTLDRQYTTVAAGKIYLRNLEHKITEFEIMEGTWFHEYIMDVLSEQTSKIEFVTNSLQTSEYAIESENGNGSVAYFIDNGQTFEVHTSADKYIVNEDCSSLFAFGAENGYNVSEVIFGDNFDTTPATTMEGMFAALGSATKLDLSPIDTRNVTKMYQMFQECTNLKSITFDKEKFITDNVVDMCSMFAFCENLETLDVSHFNTANVMDMCGMFDYCMSLTSIDVSKFNTEKVFDMRLMFNNCSSLTSIDVSNFNTENVEDMGEMFAGCTNLTQLDLTSFTFNEETNYENMFLDLGKNAASKPISVFVTAEGKAVLEEAETGIDEEYAKLVVRE